MTVDIRQGDSYAIFINLVQDGSFLTPDMIDDLEIMFGEHLRFSYLENTVKYDPESSRWYVWPTQEDTFGLEEGSHKVEVRVKYHNENTTNVKGYTIEDKVKVYSAASREVL